MISVYESGAEYVIIFFNYPLIDGNPYGLLQNEHFIALERFWNTIMLNSNAVHSSDEVDVALILPINYGWVCGVPLIETGIGNRETGSTDVELCLIASI
jgi:hypothetical protein